MDKSMSKTDTAKAKIRLCYFCTND